MREMMRDIAGKASSAFIRLLVVIAVFCGGVFAVEKAMNVNVLGILVDEAFSGSDVRSTSLLDTGEAAAYATFRSAIELYETEVPVSAYRKITEEEMEAVVADVRADPTYFYLDREVRYEISSADNINWYVTHISIDYLYPTDEIDSRRAQLEEGVAQALTWVDDSMSATEKAQAIHDYLVRTCSYDSTLQANNAYDALVSHCCVCQGYGMAYLLCMQRLGIPCVYVISEEMNHGWNMVELDGQWYHVDVTYDDALVTYDGITTNDQGFDADVSHEYFLISDATIASKGHYGWTSAHEAPTDYPAYDYPVYAGPRG